MSVTNNINSFKNKAEKEIESTYLALLETAKKCGYDSLKNIPQNAETKNVFKKEFWKRLRIPWIRQEDLQIMFCANFFNAVREIHAKKEKSFFLEKILEFFGAEISDLAEMEKIKKYFLPFLS